MLTQQTRLSEVFSVVSHSQTQGNMRLDSRLFQRYWG